MYLGKEKKLTHSMSTHRRSIQAQEKNEEKVTYF